MKKILAAVFFFALTVLAHAESLVVPSCGNVPAQYPIGATRADTIDVNGLRCIAPPAIGGIGNFNVNQGNPAAFINAWPVAAQPYPNVSTPLTGNASGTTAAVTGTLAATVGKTTYICGFDVSYIGGTAAVSPVTVVGLVGSTMTYQLPLSATGGQTFSRTYTPCIPASGQNIGISVITTADATATAVNVNTWGFQQ